MTILIVGAGFAGAVHARILAEAGCHVNVIDKRSHVGGNAFDHVDDTGIRIHRYGPHLFHTSNAAVVDWLSRFTAWVPYEHKVRAKTADRFVPLPINRDTVELVFDRSFATEADLTEFLERIRVRKEVRNSADYLHATIGETLTDLLFRPYSRKMWGLDLEELDASVVKRVAPRLDRDDRYFAADRFQMMPTAGYTPLFEAMLDHPRISVSLDTAFDKAMLADAEACFNSMPIDEFFDFRYGALPYRSIRFHHRAAPRDTRDWAVTNYTDDSAFTRETHWYVIPLHDDKSSTEVTITVEEPCDYRDNDLERYYPVKDADGAYREAYLKYTALADAEPDLTFIGRCGTYAYLDMDQVVNQSLAGARRWLVGPGHGRDGR